MQAICKDNVLVTARDNLVYCSDGKSYVLNGGYLSGPGLPTTICKSINEAFSMVVAMHGGHKF